MVLLGGLIGGLMISGVVARHVRAADEREHRFRSLLAIAADAYWEIDEKYRLVAGMGQRLNGFGLGASDGLGSVPWHEIERHPYILPLVDEGDVNALRYWQAERREPPAFIRTSSMEALREMVALGLGVTILSDMVFRPWSLDGRRIRTLPVDARLPVMEVGLAWPAAAVGDPCVDALQDFLGRAFGAPAA